MHEASPFPHIHAQALAGEAAKKAKLREQSESRALFWSACWRIGVIICCTIAFGLAYQLALAWQEGRLHLNWASSPSGTVGNTIVRRAPTNVAGSRERFFLDIGLTSKSLENSLTGRRMDEAGWSGVCAAPFPGELKERTCKVLALPVGGTDGVEVVVPDCSRSNQGLQGVINRIFEMECPQVKTTAVSIGTVLAIASAPKVIDFISLDNWPYSDKISEFDILKNFPFTEHCARSWSIYSGHEPRSIDGIRSFLEVSQGCRTRVHGAVVFGRCPCERPRPSDQVAPKTPPSKQVAPTTPPKKTSAGLSQIEVLASGVEKVHNGHATIPHAAAIELVGHPAAPSA